jgi:2-succinyl-6-hydroxy-2,4-cyclohexadiene-1-carboxylate synthase
MYYNFRGIDVHYEHHRTGSKYTLVLIHGLGGYSGDWERMTEAFTDHQSFLIPDLPGCGKSSFVDDPWFFSFEGLSELLIELIEEVNINNPILCGYSAGGRLAFYMAANNLLQNKAFISISSTPGLPTDELRTERAAEDIEHATKIMEFGIDAWVDNWLNLELFDGLKTLPESFYKAYDTRKRLNSTKILKNYLLNSGLGVMPFLQDKLRSVDQSGLLITGGNDKKYEGIAQRVCGLNKRFAHIVIPESWHTVYMEKPIETAEAIKEFLKKIE